jgi:hypothetical protein
VKTDTTLDLESIHLAIRVATIRAKQRPEDLALGDLAASVFSYTDRTSYLEQVRTWKGLYAELSGAIRAAKSVCRNAQRAGDSTASRQQADLAWQASQARSLLAWRRLAKLDSWAKRQAAAQMIPAALLDPIALGSVAPGAVAA